MLVEKSFQKILRKARSELRRMTDPIADMLTQIRNATLVGHKSCIVRYSKIKEKILDILKETGYILDYKNEDKNSFKNIRIQFAYDAVGEAKIKKIRRISKPGRRIYFAKDKLPYVLSGMGIMVISTSKGLMTNKQAKKEGVGGEAVCEIW